MYNDLVNMAIVILFVSRLQSYNIISKVVAFAYGKDVNDRKQETAMNQRIMKQPMQETMENIISGYGRRYIMPP